MSAPAGSGVDGGPASAGPAKPVAVAAPTRATVAAVRPPAERFRDLRCAATLLPVLSDDRAGRTVVRRSGGGMCGGSRPPPDLSAVVPGRRPWHGRRWRAGHLVEDARPRRAPRVTGCVEVAWADRRVTVSDRNRVPASSSSLW